MRRNARIAAITGAACLSASTLGAPAGAQFMFPGPKFPAGTGPASVAAGDLDGDTIPEVVIASFEDGVGILWGNGDGTLQPPEFLGAAEKSARVALADVDLDGSLDLVSLSHANDLLAVRLGRGDGSFEPPITGFAGDGPIVLTIADLNADTLPDVVTGNVATVGLSVLLGNGDGSFQPPETLELVDFPRSVGGGGDSPRSVSVADLDGDTAPDLVVATWPIGLSVLMGNGDGTFQPAVGFDEDSSFDTDYATVANLDADAFPDLVTLDDREDTVRVWRGNGDGTFQTPTVHPAGDGPWRVIVVDVDGQAGLDIVTASFSAGVSVLYGNGDGSFQPSLELPSPFQPNAVAATDLDGNGITDFVTSNLASSDVNVLLGNEDGSFFVPSVFRSGESPQSVAVADLDGDAIPDLVTANEESDDVGVLLGTGGGDFAPAALVPVGEAPRAVAAADLDADGTPDLVSANQESHDVSVLLGNGDGSFGPPASFPTSDGPGALEVADLDGDGALDLVVSPQGNELVLNEVSVLLGNGDGTFQPYQAFPAGFRIIALCATDLDADGVPDLAVTNLFGDRLVVLKGNGDGTFGAATPLDVGAEGFASGLAAADLDADGAQDLVVGRWIFLPDFRSQQELAVLLGNGDGSFGPASFFETGRFPVAVSATDVNGDGALDLVSASSADAGASVLLGNGDGTFGPVTTYAAGATPSSLAAADLDGDGMPDLVTANRRGDDVAVLLNQNEPPARLCDIDANAAVDRLDLGEIVRALGEPTESEDARDADGDGRITGRDVGLCAGECDLAGCRIVGCGLLGIEPALLLGWLSWRRRRRIP